MNAAPLSLRDWVTEQALRSERWIGRRLLYRLFEAGRRQMLFVIGHMRTGSSLLVHLLNSHPAIVGYGETHNVYVKPEDFGATAANVYRCSMTRPGKERYVMDKVLQKYLVSSDEVLRHPAVRIAFIARQPGAALSSMLDHNPYQGPEDAYSHYVTQLNWITQLATHLPADHWTYTTYSELVDDTPKVFHRLEHLLRLDTPLSPNYETIRHTGIRGIGDSSEHIHAGHIKRHIDRKVDDSIMPHLPEARKHFERCCQSLKDKNVY